MDAYPIELITHEAPLLLLSGLGGKEKYTEIPQFPLLNQGPLVASHLPSLTDETSERLLEFFLKHDVAGIWGRRPEAGLKINQRPVFRVRAVGREYRLPPRKANPPSAGAVSSPTEGSPTRTLHSPISPLSPDSPLFPDGALTHLWLRKHQSLLPAIFVSFFTLYTDTNDAGLQNMEDNKIIEAINQSKKHFMTAGGALSSATVIGSDEFRGSGSRTKYVAVILCERSIMTTAEVDERLTTIRRHTGMTTNANFFACQTNVSPVEQEQFVNTLLGVLYPGAVEYYRELAKHARRKRNKGSIPPPTVPTSRALSSQGWNLRYEFKLGVFAEFRQEMDVAARNFETAYEKLLSEVFEATSSWSERWAEARIIADVLVIRIVRCYLWMENYVLAKQRWSYHILRMRDVLDRKGKGTETYGFAAWISRWNKMLADMLRISGLPVFAVDNTLGRSGAETPLVFFNPERAGERLSSQELLHHPGYYYLSAAEWIKIRGRRAKKIQPGDNAKGFDTYLCPDPVDERDVDHQALQLPLLLLARTEFDQRQQIRMSANISYQIANLRIQKAPQKPELWVEALKDLRTISSRYRKEGWWNLLEDVLWKIIDCGRKGGDLGGVLIAEFELMCRSVFREKTDRRYDLSKCLEDMPPSSVKPTIVARASDIVNPLSVSYSFESPSVHAGQAVNSQLCITSNAHPSSAPLVFSELKINYEGGLKTVLLRHDPALATPPSTTPKILDLRSSLSDLVTTSDGALLSPNSLSAHSFLTAATDLSIAPGETKIYELSAILRESGTAKAVMGTFCMVNSSFDLEFINMFIEDDSASSVHPLPIKNPFTTRNGGKGVWWHKNAAGEVIKRPLRANPSLLTILPRPPKMEVIAKGLENGIYTDEAVKIGLVITNGEEEDADVGIDVKILGWPITTSEGDQGNPHPQPVITWLDDSGDALPQIPALHPLGLMHPNQQLVRYFTFTSSSIPADCTLEIKLRYHLTSDPATPTEKTVSIELPIITPFSCTYDFSPRVHPAQWPDYFSIPDKSGPHGIPQRWCLTPTLLSLSKDDITITSWKLPVLNLSGAADCIVHPPKKKKQRREVVLKPEETTSYPFLLDILKASLEDRTPSHLDISLELTWTRPCSLSPTTTILQVPRLFVPLREPRVLCTAKPMKSPPPQSPAMTLTYHLENPTSYFLTFSLLLETNELFAFSGPKNLTLHILPMTRTAVEWRVLPYVSGAWIRPQLKVLDRWFNKSLKPAPGGEGVVMMPGSAERGRGDRGLLEGVGVWVPKEGEEVEDDDEVEDEVEDEMEKDSGEGKKKLGEDVVVDADPLGGLPVSAVDGVEEEKEPGEAEEKAADSDKSNEENDQLSGEKDETTEEKDQPNNDKDKPDDAQELPPTPPDAFEDDDEDDEDDDEDAEDAGEAGEAGNNEDGNENENQEEEEDDEEDSDYEEDSDDSEDSLEYYEGSDVSEEDFMARNAEAAGVAGVAEIPEIPDVAMEGVAGAAGAAEGENKEEGVQEGKKKETGEGEKKADDNDTVTKEDIKDEEKQETEKQETEKQETEKQETEKQETEKQEAETKDTEEKKTIELAVGSTKPAQPVQPQSETAEPKSEDA